jgi:predicted nuclease with TOPRIM domain
MTDPGLDIILYNFTKELDNAVKGVFSSLEAVGALSRLTAKLENLTEDYENNLEIYKDEFFNNEKLCKENSQLTIELNELKYRMKGLET